MLNENLVERFTESFRHNWDRPAYTDWEGATLTYGEVVERILLLHHLFQESGVESGDKIAVAGRNSAHWAVTFLSAVTYGAVIVPILPDFTSDEIQHIVKHSDAKMLFASESIYDRIDERRMGGLQAVFRLHDFALLHAPDEDLAERLTAVAEAYRGRRSDVLGPDRLRFPKVPGDNLAAIVYTSGTTGFSKGVMLTHKALMINARHFIDNLDISPENTVVSFLPLAHSFGCAFEFISPTVVGCHVTFVEKMPTPKILMQVFAAVKPRIILSVPLIIEKIYKNRIKPQLESPRLKLMMKTPLLNRMVKKKIREKVSDVFGGAFQEVVVGGAALNTSVEEFFRSIDFPLANGYGMTECGPLISYTVVAERPPAGSVGKVIPYLECKIEPTDPVAGIGEVCVRGENVMLGYYKDEEATRSAIDSEGWLHTGDLGRMDENGFLYLTGRSKNIILSATGQNIYPEAIESKLNSLPLVGEALVLDDNGKLTALVYPDVERADEEGMDEQQIRDLMEQNRQELNRQLPGYSQVVRFQLLFEEFEKTPTKKIKRRLYDALR
ncbi:MAG: AMP-binding protein [Candidatus Krumholzibacteriia bacterium]